MKQKQIEKGVERDNGEKSGDSKVTDEEQMKIWGGKVDNSPVRVYSINTPMGYIKLREKTIPIS